MVTALTKTMSAADFRLALRPFESLDYVTTQPSEIRIDCANDQLRMNIRERSTPLNITDSACTTLTKHLSIPEPYWRSIPPELMVPHMNYLLENNRKLNEKRLTLGVRNDNAVGILFQGNQPPIPNGQILDIFDDVVGGDYGVKHFTHDTDRISYSLVTNQMEREVVVGDVVQGGIHITNSFSGRNALEMSAVIYRLVCTNGAIASDTIYKMKLDGINEDTPQWIRESFTKLASGFVPAVDKLIDLTTHVIEGDMIPIIQSLFDVFKVPVANRDDLLNMIMEDPPVTYYDLYNILTDYASNSEAALNNGRMAHNMMRIASRFAADVSICETCRRLSRTH